MLSQKPLNTDILLPGDFGFEETLAQFMPPNWQQIASKGESYGFVIRPGSCGLMEAVSPQEIIEYLEGGEYDDRLDEIDEYGGDDEE